MNEDLSVAHELSKDGSLRLGFFLARSRVTCFNWPSAPYHGIDRLPYITSPQEDDALRHAGRSRLVDLWVRYWDAWDNGELHISLPLAQELQQMFRNEGLDFDLVYAEIAVIPRDLEAYPQGSLWSEMLAFVLSKWRDAHDRLKRRPIDLCPLGFDISHPVPSFHSAIYQPGLHRTHPRLPDDLNSFGLFNDLDVALRLLSVANEMDYGPLPFCILQVWGVPSL